MFEQQLPVRDKCDNFLSEIHVMQTADHSELGEGREGEGGTERGREE